MYDFRFLFKKIYFSFFLIVKQKKIVIKKILLLFNINMKRIFSPVFLYKVLIKALIAYVGIIYSRETFFLYFH